MSCTKTRKDLVRQSNLSPEAVDALIKGLGLSGQNFNGEALARIEAAIAQAASPKAEPQVQGAQGGSLMLAESFKALHSNAVQDMAAMAQGLAGVADEISTIQAQLIIAMPDLVSASTVAKVEAHYEANPRRSALSGITFQVETPPVWNEFVEGIRDRANRFALSGATAAAIAPGSVEVMEAEHV